MLITITEYATRHGKTPSGVRLMAREGKLKTAQKIGRDWLVDENEPYPKDARVKSGKYINARKTRGNNDE